MIWLKNSAEQKDAMLTFAFGGFLVTVLIIIASMFVGSEFQLPWGVIRVTPPDATIVSAFLGATLISYVTRRNTKDKHKHETEMKKLESKKE